MQSLETLNWLNQLVSKKCLNQIPEVFGKCNTCFLGLGLLTKLCSTDSNAGRLGVDYNYLLRILVRGSKSS